LQAAGAAPVDRGDGGEGEGTFGLTVEPLTASRARELGVRATTGLVITDVAPDGRAAAAGLRPGDVIEGVDRKPVTSGDELRTALNDGKRPALLQVHRGSVTLFVALAR
jgi:S1-C subfamily serine protease